MSLHDLKSSDLVLKSLVDDTRNKAAVLVCASEEDGPALEKLKMGES